MNLVGIDQNVWLKTYPAVIANAALFFFALVKKPALRTYLLIFSATTLVDILVAGKIIPIRNNEVQTAVEYSFVLIGDLRFIILLAFLLYAQKNWADFTAFKIDGSVIKPALVFTLFASLLIRAIEIAKPGIFSEARLKFLTYEITFFTLTLLWIFVVLPQKSVGEKEARFLRLASIPVFVFYGLWSIADILILNGLEAGYAIRIVPNLTYYCAFLWCIFFFSR